jgi:hypothetical protein
MKLRMEPVTVVKDEQGVPQRFYWRGRPYRVTAIEDRWHYAGKWWLDGKGWHRAYFRVTARGPNGGQVTFELFKQHGGTWVLSRECD